jgi:uncharacterized protein YjbI with pentapeptide repeats
MHSRDPKKSRGLFLREIRAIVERAEAGNFSATFAFFMFPPGSYEGIEFPVKCDFSFAHFLGDTEFCKSTFEKEATFSSVVFEGRASFSGARFCENGSFLEAKFSEGADFSYAEFGGMMIFIGARFGHESSFVSATFGAEADLSGAHFGGRVRFWRTAFKRVILFRNTQFEGPVEFWNTQFASEDPDKSSAIFALCRFPTSAPTVFYRTDLSQALFHNCDISFVTFSSVRWRQRRTNGKRFLFEEEVNLEDKLAACDLCVPSFGRQQRNYQLIAETYQQLKKNYDERKDYWTAGDFHYGEMEMKRLNSKSQNPVVIGLKRHLGLTALYKYGAQYGESYSRPLLLLLCTILTFGLLFPLPGLDLRSDAGSAVSANHRQLLSYTSVFAGTPSAMEVVTRSLPVIGNSLITSVSVAAFQKDLRYAPAYPWGRILAMLELLCSSTALGLFFIAIRRQFRR